MISLKSLLKNGIINSDSVIINGQTGDFLDGGHLPYTERFDSCICIVVSEETGTLSLANQGKLERPITSSRLQELLINLIGNQNSLGASKSSLGKNASSPKTNSSDNIISEINEKEIENSEIFVNKKD